MKIYDKSYDITNATNPWLISKKSGLLEINGIPLTAEHIWSKSGQDRHDLVDLVFQHYRKNGFPKQTISDKELSSTYKSIKKNTPDSIIANGEIKNSSSLGSNIIKHFMGDLYYSTSGGNGISCIDAFNNDDILLDVLRNRMGFRTSSEDGTERPYVFSMSDKDLIQGFRSSGRGFSTSQFKIMVAKYVYWKYGVKKVLDFSCGWGARALAAGSLDMEYVGIDPLTNEKVNDIMTYFDIAGKTICGGSEDIDQYHLDNDFDLAWSSPPFFDLEIYAKDNSQCYNKFNDYNDWLEKYWEKTVKGCFDCLKSNGKFGFFMVNMVDKYNIANDMVKIASKHFTLLETVPVKTSQSHLSGKKKSGKVSKTTEHLYIFEKV
jgi:tRNA1(Val) A37 N6-methylase TrmN6